MKFCLLTPNPFSLLYHSALWAELYRIDKTQGKCDLENVIFSIVRKLLLCWLLVMVSREVQGLNPTVHVPSSQLPCHGSLEYEDKIQKGNKVVAS